MANGSDCLPIIRCSCGFELLLLPELKVMGQAIEKHALEHKNEYGLNQEQTESLKEQLIAQAFKLASEMPKLIKKNHKERFLSLNLKIKRMFCL